MLHVVLIMQHMTSLAACASHRITPLQLHPHLPQVRDGKVAALYPAGHSARHSRAWAPVVDLRGKMVLPTFADLHTHIGAGRRLALGQGSRGLDGHRLSSGKHAMGFAGLA